MKIEIADRILYQNEDIILMVFIKDVHSIEDIERSLDQYFDDLNLEVSLYVSYKVNNRFYMIYSVL
jgi:hypothetical protein